MKQIKQTRLFSTFLAELSKTQALPRPFYSSPYVNQSSVGIIFKVSGKSNFKFESIQDLIGSKKVFTDISLLLTQRGGYETDINAYNVVFPGGQIDGTETDLEACKREIQQEVSLNTDQECLYMGQIPQNFYYSKRKGRSVFISCHVWVLKQESKFIPKLNPQELVQYRWVPLLDLIDPQNLTIFRQNQLGIFSRLGWKYLQNNIKNNFLSVQFPSLNVGLKRDVWGLTYWLIAYLLQMSKNNIVNESKQLELNQEDKTIINSIDLILNRLRNLNISFKQQYLLKKPVIWTAKAWNYFYRSRQFLYPQKPLALSPLILGMIAIILMICFFV